MANDSPTSRRLARAGLEFLVIVASILAAFALDAWWDSRAERDRVLTRLSALETELESTRGYIGDQRARLESVRVAVSDLLRHVSPDAALLAPDSLNVLMDLSFRMGTIELQGRAPQTMESAGDVATLENAELTGLLASWPIALAEVRTKSALLEDNRERILDYLHGRYPTLDITQKTGDMGRYPHSSFEASAAAIQRDRRVEGLFGNRGMLIEDTDARLERLDTMAAELLHVIREAR
jgi:hypothetical protein